MPAAGTTTSKKPPSMRALTARMKEIQLSFNDIWRFVQVFKESHTATDVDVRLCKLDELWEGFSETLVEIFSHDDYNAEGNSWEKERMEFSDRYYEVKSFLMDKAKELQEPNLLEQSLRAGDSSMRGGIDHVRLPQIKLQTFNGDIDEWLSFRDLFTSLIHWKPDLPEVEKFHYLKGCLQGEPKSLIDPLQITKANYQVAWDLLLKRYNNSKQLKKRQVQALFNLPTLPKESVTDLHVLIEGFERIVQTLDQIIQSADYKDLLLVNILTTRLDPVTRRGWEEFSAMKETDTLADLFDFLRRRLQVLDCLPTTVDTRGAQQQQQIQAKQRLPPVKTSYSSTHMSGGRCVACSSNHPLYQCSAFQRMEVTERDGLLKTHSLCRNCFRTGHQAKECQSKYSCRSCKGRHHTLVCFKSERDTDKDTKVAAVARGNKPSVPTESSNTSSQVANVAATEVLVAGAAHQYSSQVLLATAVVVIEDDDGNRFPARALLDSGSESNFVTERLSQRMKVTRNQVDISVVGIGQAATKVKHRIQAVLRSRVSQYSRELSFLVLPKVTVNLPTTTINTDKWAIPDNIQLADPAFFESKVVDLVLGIEAFFDFFETGRRISLGEQLPTLNDSVFGWVVCGGFSVPSRSLHINCNMSTTEDLDALMSRFWSCEEVESGNTFSLEEKRCEELFLNTVKRDETGRYTVSLPKDEDAISRLGESRDIALRRLQGTERRLARDENLRKQYTDFMEEYLHLGHMRKVEEVATDSVKRCYLPHHPVVKDSSTTTKVRVVFDASCKTSSGLSLNDVLLVGPVIQEDLRSIILRSRTKQIMLVSDVEKMFRQINVCPEDRPLQCILWRNSSAEEISTYELNTVTYGTKPAPFLATRTLKQLALDEEERYPLAAKAAIEDTYMDDVITGADEVKTAIDLRVQLEAMTSSGGFRLRKWASNCPNVLNGIEEEELAIRSSEGIVLNPDPSIKTLGLTWMPVTDTLRFQFTIPNLNTEVPLTKRCVLSVIATLFDPLGLLGAAITTAKIFMQLLWTLRDENDQRLDWDQPLPPTVGEAWKKYHEQLPLFNEIRIDRCVIITDAESVEIHCFSDASEKAYGACLYLRSENAVGEVKVRLLTSKSKVAPLKCQTIPRLELCGALLAAQLYEKVDKSIKITVKSYFWTDSTCVLRWLAANPTTWTTFVANRVAKIQSITQGSRWSHVPGIQNPADLISRGISPNDIVLNTFWWQGPSWLEKTEEYRPLLPDYLPTDEGDEEKRHTVLAGTVSTIAEFNQLYIGKFSSYSDLLRRTAYWLRLIKLLRTPRKDRKAPTFLSTDELKKAENTLVRLVQREVFVEEWKALSKENAVSKSSPLRWFNPFVSQDQLIRLGGRLKHSMESENTKHPAVLPTRHIFTRLLLRYYHERLLHAGPQLLLGVVRLRFWPLGGRSVVRHIIHQCHICFRSKPSTVQQFMGDLPASRVTVSRPFSRTGVDYFGPLYVRPVPRRTSVKAYVAICVCLCTEAVHLELVTDLSTDRFLQALRRFVARRGRCTDIYSDNGTNFVGARNKLQDFLRLLKDSHHNDVVSKQLAKEGIQWHFNPPSAPHFGGIWEAAVRSAKNHLLKVVGETPVSPEDMNTLLVQVEGCLNSRPLTPMSDDPNDLQPLTPAHFLVGESLQAVPDPDLTVVPMNRLTQWQLTQQRLQNFWKRWRREYLCQLQGRTKRWKPAVRIDIGKLVVIQDDNQPPMRWKMGRIVQTHPGDDGTVRVVTLKTATGMLTRPVERLCLLPTSDDNDDTQPTEVDNPQS
ncbi:uncharacterized protein LOC131679327 [Topomyia yanbarensis]|uniref:uncharacterized protein LOC131679327 n=1 Tax=Topomyia yanbarensis TaxID=2498891 RepID=UPI00273AD418|nr:uncharacterized protein LOC131679327 [Topomyia yanbarensis]